MSRLAHEWPGHPLRDQFGQPGAREGLSGYEWASQEPLGSFQGHSGAVWTTSGQYKYVLVYSRTMFSFVNILAPENSTKLVLYSKFSYGSQFSEEKDDLEICFLIPEILTNPILAIFFKHPVVGICSRLFILFYLFKTDVPKN